MGGTASLGAAPICGVVTLPVLAPLGITSGAAAAPREPVPGRVAASRPPATGRRRHLAALAEAGIDPSPQVIAGLATGVDPGPLPASP